MTDETKPLKRNVIHDHPSNDGLLVLGLPATVLGLVAVLVGVDLITEFDHVSSLHFAVELTLIVLTTSVGGWLWVLLVKRIRFIRQAYQDAIEESGKWEERANTWRKENEALLSGLSDAIDLQLKAWDLTPAETDVGLLLLKGLSLKEIAQIRDVSERTVRDQAGAIYRKSGLANRNEFAAFFLEDLLTSRT